MAFFQEAELWNVHSEGVEVRCCHGVRFQALGSDFDKACT